MINQTFSWSFFCKNDTSFTAENFGITELKEASLEEYLEDIMTQKTILDEAGINSVIVYHTLLYENQCNTEFSPKVMSLLLDMNATFCISADKIA